MMPRRLVVIPDAARRPAWRAPSFRPSPLHLGARELGQSGPSVNWGNIGQTIMFGAFGAGAMYAAPLLPDPMKTIAMVGGVGLIGYAAYSFLGSSAKENNEVPAGTAAKIPTPAEFALITGQILSPKSGSRVGYNFFSNTYPVKVLLSNPNPNPVTVTLQLVVHEAPYVFVFIPAQTEDYVRETTTRIIPATGNITVDLSPYSETNRWFANLEMNLTLRIIRMGNDFKDLDHVSFNLSG